MVNVILLVWSILWLAASAHYLQAVRHGAFQRKALMLMCETSDQLAATQGLFDAHIWRVVTLRNPWVIYPPILSSLTARLSA